MMTLIRNQSYLAILAAAAAAVLVTTTTTSCTNALSINNNNHVRVRTTTTRTTSRRTTSSTTSLALGPLDDRDNLSDYGKQKQKSELDSLVSKRDQIRAQKLANLKPDDDTPRMEEMT